jgi:hypothetical protein
MRPILVLLILTGALCLYLDEAAAQGRKPTTGNERTTWQQQMDLAQRAAAAGKAYNLVLPAGVLSFYNNPHPFCYTYMIPGDRACAPPLLMTTLVTHGH